MGQRINVLVCDDHLIVRQGIRQILSDADDMRVASEAANGPDAIRQVRELADGDDRIDVVLLDIAMPQRDGLDMLKQFKNEFPKLPVLILSTYSDKQYAIFSLRLGAAGYLNKSTDPDDLIAAVRKAAAGGIYVNAAAGEALAHALGGARARQGLDALSHREHQVYRLLVSGHSVSQIGAQLGLAANTVSTYRARVLEKTGTRNDVELTLFAERHAR